MSPSDHVLVPSKGSFLAVGVELPSITLPSTHGDAVDFSRLSPLCILIVHPLALARAQVPPPAWAQIPGAAGCTEQLLGFKAHYGAFRKRNVDLFGISTQSSIVQRAVAEDLDLPFPLLSDADYIFSRALRLPMLQGGRRKRVARIVLVVRNCRVERIFYPIPSPAQSAATILYEWGCS